MKTRVALAVVIVLAVVIGVWAYHGSQGTPVRQSEYERVLASLSPQFPVDRELPTVSNRGIDKETLRTIYATSDPRAVTDVLAGMIHAQALTAEASDGKKEQTLWFALLRSPELARKLVALEYKAATVHVDEMALRGIQVVDYPQSTPLRGIKGDFAAKLAYTMRIDGAVSTTTQAHIVRGNTVVGLTARGCKVPDKAIVALAGKLMRQLQTFQAPSVATTSTK